MSQGNEPFVPREDRPDVSLKPETPITQLTVRDLSALIHSGLTFKGLKREIDIKYFKHEKHEKFEKYEIKELKFEKNEKIELEPKGFEPGDIPKGFEPGERPAPDPRIDQLIQSVSRLTSTVEEINKRLDTLENRKRG